MNSEKTEKKEAKKALKEERQQEKIAAKEKKKTAKKKQRSRKGLVVFLVVLIVLIVACLGVFGYDYYLLKNDKILNHVTFVDSHLDNTTETEAKAIIDQEFDTLLARVVTLSYGEDKAWDYTAEQLGLCRNTAEVYQNAYDYGRSGNIINRYKDRIKAEQGTINIENTVKIDKGVMTPILEAIAAEIGIPAQDARFQINAEGGLDIIPSADGVALDHEQTSDAIWNALADTSISSVTVIANVNAHPERTTEELEGMNINGVLATCSTKYNAGDKDRSHNLWQSCQYLDMTIIDPGATFSFNDTVGERTTARGFKKAIIIENGQYTPGMGGGVCQVSTTLYGALLRTASLDVTKRKPHSLVSAYVEPGQDAMVAWGSSDLAFVNQYETPVLIHATCGGGTITMTIFGDTSKKQEVKLISDVVRYIPFTTETVTDPSLSTGESKVTSSGGRGLECYLYKKVYQDGVEISSSTVSHDTYRAQKRIVAVGP